MIESVNKLIPVLCFLFSLLINESQGSSPWQNHSQDFNMEKDHNAMNRPFNGDSKWIWTADRTKQSLGHVDNHRMAYFRRKFKVSDSNFHLTVHVSADSRYILWCNGKIVGRGPAKGDITHHFYDSYTLDDLLKKLDLTETSDDDLNAYISKIISEIYKGSVDCGDTKKNFSPHRSGKQGPQGALPRLVPCEKDWGQSFYSSLQATRKYASDRQLGGRGFDGCHLRRW